MLGLLGALAVSGLATASEPPAASFLAFESVPDGRCQILSQGGKLRVVRNHHARRDIDFRLVRMLSGTRPQGRVVGVAVAGGEPHRLGCTEVDGRPQDWILERARFVAED